MSASLIPLKAWVAEEAMREGIDPHTIYARRCAGWYPQLSVIKLNKRRIFICCDETPPRIRLMEWIKSEAAREGVTSSAIYMRIARGKYPGLEITRINRSVAFVERSL